ncbi:MAG: hypothetical protein MUF47_07575 [Porphyrobacter sp.]|nr:hypothetical protein [Porphyrobacter sp.]
MTYLLAIAVFVIAAVAALVCLVDSSIVARQVAGELARERALFRLGFVEQVNAREMRPRPVKARPAAGRVAPAKAASMRNVGLMQASRARALPLRFAAPACDAA